MDYIKYIKKIRRNAIKLLPDSGFTIIELLVVFSVVIIISGIGFVTFSTYNKSQVLSQQAQNIKITIEDAKNSSLSQVIPDSVNCSLGVLNGYKVQINQLERTYQVFIQCGISEEEITNESLAPNILFDNTTTCDSIEFKSLSGEVDVIPASPCQIVIKNDTNSPIEGENAIILGVDQAGNVTL